MKNRKTRSAMRRMLFTLALVLVVAVASVGGTIAWLTQTTGTLTNTFTVGNVNITLKESDGQSVLDATEGNRSHTPYHIIPGTDLEKDPKVTVVAGSEKCWLFVEVTEVNWPDTENISYSVDEDVWTQLDETVTTYVKDENDKVVKTINTIVYYIDIDDAAKMGKDYHVLTGDKVTVSQNLSKTDADKIPTGEYAPSLTFKAYAIQKDNTGTVAEAWTKLNAATSGN